MQLEEGELSEDSDSGFFNPYTPLARPTLPVEPVITAEEDDKDHETNEVIMASRQKKHSLKPAPLRVDSDDNDSDSDDNESDSDNGMLYGKRCKMTAPAKSTRMPNKYSVWSRDPNDYLTDFMNQIVVVDRPENDRNVENYPIPKEKRNNYYNSDRKRKVARGRKSVEIVPIELEPLTVNDMSPLEDVAKEIAEKLNESNQELVLKIVDVLGKEKSIAVYEKTRLIERAGGMMILSGTRKRTSGGVYIYLVRSDVDLNEEQKQSIFDTPRPKLVANRSGANGTDSTKEFRRRKKNKSRNSKVKDHSQLSNPPPSPDPDAADLPQLPVRRDLIAYDDLGLTDFV